MTANFTLYFLMILLSPLLALSVNLLSFKKNPVMGAKIASFGILIGCMNAGISWYAGWPFLQKMEFYGFRINAISWLMATLILGISAIVHQFSLSYMAGDRNYRRYFLFLSLITVSSLLMAASDHLVLFMTFWTLNNAILVLLMTHKFEWEAAKNSGVLAMKTFSLGLLFLGLGAGLLAYHKGSLSLAFIIDNSATFPSWIRMTALFLIILAALTQSGAWPFHRWLLSSLNSPTPVSALMHAGLVNAGGFLLVRFAPVFLQERLLLDFLFILSLTTLVLGGIWKLLQSDIKRMLACSTMTQMGFMLMQCSLGLFSAALAHLFLHGLFKAFLFLKSGSASAEMRLSNVDQAISLRAFLLSLMCGGLGALGFMWVNNLPMTVTKTSLVLIFFCWIASAKVAMTLLQSKTSLLGISLASAACLTVGSFYGMSVSLLENAVAELQISQPFQLNLIHILSMVLIACVWLAFNLLPFIGLKAPFWWRRFYVAMLNASQPDPKTVTTSKNGYKF